jgi:hypothetical protein
LEDLMITLLFPLADALRLAEHAAAAPEHAPSLNEQGEQVPAGPRLLWVKDEGTYVMSSGLPPLLRDPDNPGSNIVVYADSYGPGTRQELGHMEEIGGDDFIEDLPLDVPFGTHPTLLDALRKTHAAGFKWLSLDLPDASRYTIAMAASRRPQHTP